MKNKIINGDCLEEMINIPDMSVDLIITDPPYSTPVVTAFGREKVKNTADLSIQESYFKQVKSEYERILKPNGRIFIFCDDKFYPILSRSFYSWQNIGLMIWDKKKIGMGNPIRKRHELIMYASRDSFEYNRTEGITHYPSVIEFSMTDDKVHPAQKPVGLIEYLIKGFSNEGDTVLDNYAGSGTTLLAAKNLNRNYIGIEMSEDYIRLIEQRLKTNEADKN